MFFTSGKTLDIINLDPLIRGSLFTIQFFFLLQGNYEGFFKSILDYYDLLFITQVAFTCKPYLSKTIGEKMLYQFKYVAIH